MKTEIEMWNGSGWNHYAALREIKSLKVGTLGLAARQGISKIEVAPRDSEKPFGIAARYFDAEGELMFTQGFDQNDSAHYIRECVFALLTEGVQNRINARAAEIRRTAYTNRISAWILWSNQSVVNGLACLAEAQVGLPLLQSPHSGVTWIVFQ